MNPIVRLNGCTDNGAPIDGYELIPEDVKLLHAEDFRDDAHYDAHLAKLIRQLSEAIPSVGKLVAVPELLTCSLALPDRINALRNLMLVDLQKPVVVSGIAARVGFKDRARAPVCGRLRAIVCTPDPAVPFLDGLLTLCLIPTDT